VSQEAEAGSAANSVSADQVEISQSQVSAVDGRTVSLNQSGVGRVKADEVSVSQSGIGLVRATSLKVGDRASAFAVLADEVTVEQGGNVFMLLAGDVSGEVRPVLDLRSALAIGVGFGLALGLLRRLR
jgi:hypothetical protein